jgi:hypothetical protein
MTYEVQNKSPSSITPSTQKFNSAYTNGKTDITIIVNAETNGNDKANANTNAKAMLMIKLSVCLSIYLFMALQPLWTLVAFSV